jgi:hypothetical protein
MSTSEVQEVLSADRAGRGDNNNLKLVPVSESIRFKKRAQSAERKIEDLAEQLAEAKAEAKTTAEQLRKVQVEQKLVNKLAAAGVVDLETAMLIAKARMEGEAEADIDSVINKQLRKEKQYLFVTVGGIVTAKKTAGAKDRMEGSQTVLERAAKRAATTGSRIDLQEYLKLRRNFV